MPVVVCYIVCAVVWSTTWFGIRATFADGAGFPIYTSAALRFTLAAVILIVAAASGAARPGPRGRRQLGFLVLAGALNGIGYVMVYSAERTLPGGLVAVIFAAIPPLTAVAATLTRTEAIRPSQYLAAVVSLAGVGLIGWRRLAVEPEQAVGVLFAFGGVLASISYSLVMKREGGEVHPLAAAAVFLTVTAVITTAVALAEHEHLPSPIPVGPTLAIVYLAVLGSVVTFVCYFYLLKRVSLMVASTLVIIQSVTALLIDARFEAHLRLDLPTYLGAGATLVGLGWNLLARTRGSDHVRPLHPDPSE